MVLSANVLSMTISVVLVIYDMVIIKHYFASGILAPTIMTIDSDFAITVFD